MGVYRAAFTSIQQTEPLTSHKVKVPVVALGGTKGLGAHVMAMVKMVAENVEGGVIADCGHFAPEERPEEIVCHVLAMTKKTARR
jgi:pimeloyl-ACP methyl ester carboxylesterase